MKITVTVPESCIYAPAVEAALQWMLEAAGGISGVRGTGSWKHPSGHIVKEAHERVSVCCNNANQHEVQRAVQGLVEAMHSVGEHTVLVETYLHRHDYKLLEKGVPYYVG